MAKRKTKSRNFVLDCSLTVAWFFEDETDDYAESVEDALTETGAVVPSLWRLEVANALLMGERRERTSEAKVTAFLSLLQLLPISVDDQTTARAWRETLVLARANDLSVYDAAYLELAVRRRLPLASLDEQLKAAAAAIGVEEFQP